MELNQRDLVQDEAAPKRDLNQASLSPEPSFQVLRELRLITNHSFILPSSLFLQVKLTADWAWLESIPSAFLITFWTRPRLCGFTTRVWTTLHAAGQGRAGPPPGAKGVVYSRHKLYSLGRFLLCGYWPNEFSDIHIPCFLFRFAKATFRWHTKCTALCAVDVESLPVYSLYRARVEKVERDSSLLFSCCRKLLF